MPTDNDIRSATVDRVIDGDTFVVTIHLGYDTYTKQHIRLYGYDAPEMNTIEGRAAKFQLEQLLLGSSVFLQLRVRGRSFIRWVCDVWLGDSHLIDNLALEVRRGYRQWTVERHNQVMNVREELP